MNRRTRRRVDTGFRSLRDLAICCVGVYGFWYEITRAPHPDRYALGFSVLLMAAPSVAAVYRLVNAVLGSGQRALRDMAEEEEER